MTHILSYNHLGNYGRLGNQMFQYAALCAAAKNLGMRPMANLSNSDLDLLRMVSTDHNQYIQREIFSTLVTCLFYQLIETSMLLGIFKVKRILVNTMR